MTPMLPTVMGWLLLLLAAAVLCGRAREAAQLPARWPPSADAAAAAAAASACDDSTARVFVPLTLMSALEPVTEILKKPEGSDLQGVCRR